MGLIFMSESTPENKWHSSSVSLTSGHTTLNLPTGRSANGAIANSAVAVDFAPGQREVDLALTYRGSLAGGAEGYFGVLHAINSGNIGGASDTGIATGLHLTF